MTTYTEKAPLEERMRTWMQSTVTAKRMFEDQRNRPLWSSSRFICADDLLLNLGSTWTPKPVPTGIEIGEPNRCYDNALDLMLEDPERFTYVEGYGLHVDLIWPVFHAWVLDEEDGLVFDSTPSWPRSLETLYWGLAMPKDVVLAAAIRNSTTGVFEGDWIGDFYFVREGWRDCV